MSFFTPVVVGFAPMSATQRSQVVVTFFSHSNPATRPFQQPGGLRALLNEQEWQSRTVAIWNHFARYTWSKLQRAYLWLALFLSIFGPILIHILVSRLTYSGLEPLRFDASNEEIRERIVIIRRAHMINFATVTSLLILLWVPYIGFKSLGKKRLIKLLESFNQADAARGNMQALNWTCARTSTFQSNGTIVIQLPVAFVSSSQPTLFHQGAYMPEYLQQGPAQPAPLNQGYQVNPATQAQYPAPAGPPPANYEAQMLGLGFEHATNPQSQNNAAAQPPLQHQAGSPLVPYEAQMLGLGFEPATKPHEDVKAEKKA